MNARSTPSGTISVLIEPCRKKSKARGDQVGTWAISLAVDFRVDECMAGLSLEVAHESRLKKIRKFSALQINGVSFISRQLFYGAAPGCKAHLSLRRRGLVFNFRRNFLSRKVYY